MNKREIGFAAEERAVSYLVNHGYTIIIRNFQYRGGEIDIIAKTNHGTICFIEVKSAHSLNWGDPVFNVTIKKQKQVWRTAEVWLAKNNLRDQPCRFDVIAIKGDSINHIPDAFRMVGPASF
jgi:putative endonuclease